MNVQVIVITGKKEPVENKIRIWKEIREINAIP
jgi:hypothetical protein